MPDTSDSSAPQLQPKLQAPGAGLPLLESFVLRYYYGKWVSPKSRADQNLLGFDRINQKILMTVAMLDLAQLHKKVLVPRLRGIEDSSRFWSAAETLEHIEIVGDLIAEAIEKLSRGEVPAKRVGVADVKPKGKYKGVDARPAFEKFSARTLAKLSPLEIRHAEPYFWHPWLGEISPLQWSWVLMGHSSVHLNQIKHIIAGLA